MALEKALLAKAALTNILGAAAAGRWVTVGYQGQSVSGEAVLNNLRRLIVYYAGGAFPEGRSSPVSGPFRHEVTLKIGLLVSADAKADLSALDDPESTPAVRAAALAASLDASARADAAWDELASLVWNEAMRPSNYDLGQAMGVVADRWIPRLVKDDVQPRGSLVVLTGSMDYTCAVMEIPTGGTPVAGESVDLGVGITADVTGQAFDPAGHGVEATQPPEEE